MTALAETAYAKINLALHVRRRRDDGYHDIETLFAFAEDGDRLYARLADGISMTVSGPFAEGLSDTDNLVVRAAELIKAHFRIEAGAAITLDKLLPVASGIGGGSADAAATARLLRRLWSIEADDNALERLLEPLGADIAACVRSEAAYGNGTGADLQQLPDAQIQGKALLLVNPLQPVATGPVFAAWDGVDHGGLDVTELWPAVLAGRNDLEAPAISICPAIADVLHLLKQSEADLVRMSGSGATCFALFETTDAMDAALRAIDKACPSWWTMASCLR